MKKYNLESELQANKIDSLSKLNKNLIEKLKVLKSDLKNKNIEIDNHVKDLKEKEKLNKENDELYIKINDINRQLRE